MTCNSTINPVNFAFPKAKTPHMTHSKYYHPTHFTFENSHFPRCIMVITTIPLLYPIALLVGICYTIKARTTAIQFRESWRWRKHHLSLQAQKTEMAMHLYRYKVSEVSDYSFFWRLSEVWKKKWPAVAARSSPWRERRCLPERWRECIQSLTYRMMTPLRSTASSFPPLLHLSLPCSELPMRSSSSIPE